MRAAILDKSGEKSAFIDSLSDCTERLHRGQTDTLHLFLDYLFCWVKESMSCDSPMAPGSFSTTSFYSTWKTRPYYQSAWMSTDYKEFENSHPFMYYHFTVLFTLCVASLDFNSRCKTAYSLSQNIPLKGSRGSLCSKANQAAFLWLCGACQLDESCENVLCSSAIALLSAIN